MYVVFIPNYLADILTTFRNNVLNHYGITTKEKQTYGFK
jgi:hypothetical protein